MAKESAGVVLAGNGPHAVLSMVDLSPASYRKIIQNLLWASGYNVIAVPLAAGVLAFAQPRRRSCPSPPLWWR